MIKVTYDSQPHEPNSPYHEEAFDAQEEAEEFMVAVREHGGEVVEWHDMTDSECRHYFEAIHCPDGY